MCSSLFADKLEYYGAQTQTETESESETEQTRSHVFSIMAFGMILPSKKIAHFSPSKFDWEFDVSGAVDKAEASVSFSWNLCSRCASLSRATFC